VGKKNTHLGPEQERRGKRNRQRDQHQSKEDKANCKVKVRGPSRSKARGETGKWKDRGFVTNNRYIKTQLHIKEEKRKGNEDWKASP